MLTVKLTPVTSAKASSVRASLAKTMRLTCKAEVPANNVGAPGSPTRAPVALA